VKSCPIIKLGGYDARLRASPSLTNITSRPPKWKNRPRPGQFRASIKVAAAWHIVSVGSGGEINGKEQMENMATAEP
jgi:hypothetical protein